MKIIEYIVSNLAVIAVVLAVHFVDIQPYIKFGVYACVILITLSLAVKYAPNIDAEDIRHPRSGYEVESDEYDRD